MACATHYIQHIFSQLAVTQFRGSSLPCSNDNSRSQIPVEPISNLLEAHLYFDAREVVP